MLLIKRLLPLLLAALLAACQVPINTPDSPPAPRPTITATAANTAVPLVPITATPSSTPSPMAMRSPTTASTPSITPGIAMVTVPAGSVFVPILLYHHVSDAGKTRYFVPVGTFREQMQALKQAGYATLTISQLAEVIRQGGQLPLKPVAITFDDGYEDTYTNAFPILRELGYTATAYIITATLGTHLSYGYMQEDALKELAAAGWEIGSHSVSHTSLLSSRLGIGNELKQSKADLETKLGLKIHSFSYPYGISNAWIEARVADNGYDSAVGLNNLNTHASKQLFFLSRREVYRGLNEQGFAALLGPSEADDIIATQTAAAAP